MKNVKLDFYTEDDLQFLHEMLSDEQSVKYLEGMYTTELYQSKIRLLSRLEDQKWEYRRRFVIKDAETGIPVGEVSGRTMSEPSTMDILIVIHPSFRGKGYAKAGTCEFIKYIIDTVPEITKFRMEINSSNVVSLEIAKSLEFDLIEFKEHMQYWEKDVR